MRLIKKEKFDKQLKKEFFYSFNIDVSGSYLIKISASCKSWRQNLIALKSFFKDDDDLKLIIDGQIQQNTEQKSHKYWFWCGRTLEGKTKEFNQELNLSQGLHYIELWADRTPILHKMILGLDKIDFKVKAKVVWEETVLRKEPNQNSQIIIEKIKRNEPFILNDQPLATQQFIRDVLRFWEDCKNKLRDNGKVLFFISLFISVFILISAALTFLFKEPFPIPPDYKDFTVLAEKKIDINKDNRAEKLIIVSSVPTKFTFGITKIILVRKNGSFLELPKKGGMFLWWQIADFNKNKRTDIAVLYDSFGSAGFRTFYLYEWTGQDFKILFTKDDIANQIDFKDLDNDGLEEILYSFQLSKWDKKISEIYKWNKEKEDYIKISMLSD